MQKINSIKDIQNLLQQDLVDVDKFLTTSVDSQISLIKDISSYLIKSGGKRLRPILVLLTCRALEYTGTHHITLASVVELIHTATLLHDDVVDNSTVRRGKQTANIIWDNKLSVLTGDFLYSCAFKMILPLKNFEIMDLLATCSNQLAQGEVQQLAYSTDIDIDEEKYFSIIQKKTATLFQAATASGAVLAQKTGVMQSYGTHLGIAFQISDDVLDYQGDTKSIGKNIGDDLQDGKLTLPLIHAYENANPADKQTLREIIKTRNVAKINVVKEILQNTASLEYCQQVANSYSTKAKNCLKDLPDSIYKEALEFLCDFCISRNK